MGWLHLESMKKFLIGKTVQRVDASNQSEAVIVFDDNTAVKLRACIDWKNLLWITGGSINISPWILATPLKLKNGEAEVIQLEVQQEG